MNNKKKYNTDNRREKDMTVEDVINLLLYNPYKEDFSVMKDEDERLHIKSNTWCVILNHKTGDFSLTGELHKYYEIDIISSIRDCFGQLYSFFNVMYDSIPTGEWIVVPYKDTEKKIQEDAKKETEKERREYRNKYQLEYYQKKKGKLKKEFLDRYSSI